MNMGMGFRLSPELRQVQTPQLLIELREKLAQLVGALEKQVLDKVEFIDVDFDDPTKAYHMDMLGGLLTKESDEEDSLVASIIKRVGKPGVEVKKIKLERFEEEDISFDIGTKRNVDLVTIEFEDGDEFTMTVSLDKEKVDLLEQSPSLQEAEMMETLQEPVPQFQRYYGSTEVEDDDGVRGLICKEYLPGEMLATATDATQPNEPAQKAARAAGKAIGEILSQLGALPKDCNPLNIIVIRDTEPLVARFCDTEALVRSPESIKHELTVLVRDLGTYGADFRQGLEEVYKGPLL